MNQIDVNDYFKILRRAQEDGYPVKYYFISNREVKGISDLFIEYGTLYEAWQISFIYAPNTHYKELCYLYYDFKVSEGEDEENILEDCNNFLKEIDAETSFTNMGDFEEALKEWRDGIDKDFQVEKEYYTEESSFLRELEKIKPVDVLHVEKEIITSLFPISFEDNSYTFFETSEATAIIPFIQWINETGESQIKIYLPSDQFEEIDYTYLKPQTKPVKNSLFFYILVNPKKITENSYLTGELSFDTRECKIKYPRLFHDMNMRDFLVREMTRTFKKSISIEEIKDIEFLGHVDYSETEYREDVFYYLLMTDARFRRFFINEEKISWASEQSRLKIDYRGFRIPHTNIEKKSQKTISVSFNVVGNIVKSKNQVITRISIVKGIGESEIYAFIDELRYLLGYLRDMNRSVLEKLESYIKVSSKPVEKKKEFATNLYARKIDILKEKAKEIFKGRSRAIQCPSMPIIIEEKDVPDWKQLRVNGEERKILLFPPVPTPEQMPYHKGNIDKPQYYVCPNDEYPFPTLAKITGAEEHDFPIAPKCLKTRPPVEINLYEARKNTSEESSKVKENITVTLVQRKFGEQGLVPEEIGSFLRHFTDEQVLRHGSDQGPSSLISAVIQSDGLFTDELVKLIPTPSFSYRKSSAENREIFYQNIRKELAKRPEIIKQEFFDEDLDSIRNNMLNSTWDSSTHYHALEVFLEVNIFVFVQDNKKFYFEIPRSANMNVRVFNDEWPCVIILKSKYLDSSNPSFDYLCTVEDPEIINAYRNSYKNYVWDKDHRNKIVCRLFPYDCPYFFQEDSTSLDWTVIFAGFEIVSQYIDGYGKARILNIRKGEDDELMSVYILPTQPLNVPYDEEIYPVDRTLIDEYFENKPSDVSKDGVFFEILGFQHGIFVPTLTDNSDVTIDRGPPFITTKDEHEYSEYRRLKRTSNLLLDCIEWCWRNDEEQRPASEWFDQYVKIGVSEENVTLNTERVKIAFPILTKSTTEDAILALESWWNNNVFDGENGTINLYPDLVNKLRTFFIDLDRKTKSSERIEPSFYVGSELRSSFLISGNNIVIADTSAYENYIHGIRHRNSAEIKTLINPEGHFPQLLEIKSRIYIVQTTMHGKREEALYIAEKWDRESINVGASDQTVIPEEYYYAVYLQTIDGLVNLEDNTSGKTEYLEIIKIGLRFYAMLRLL